MRVPSTRRTYVATVCVLGAAIAVGTTFGIARAAQADEPPSGSPIQIAPNRGNVPMPVGPPAEVVAALAARLPLVRNARVVLSRISGEEGNTWSEGLVLEYELRVSAFEGGAIGQAIWEGDLLTGGVADVYASRGFGAIREVHAWLVTPNGQRSGTVGGVGVVVRDQVFDDFPSDVERTIAKAARLFGLRDVTVAYIQGLQRAIVITATSDHPKRDVTHLTRRRSLDVLLGRSATDFEGVFLEVKDGAGATVYSVGRAPRNGAGVSWASPELGVRTGFGGIPAEGK